MRIGIVFALLLLSACAHRKDVRVAPAPLGRVVIYRSGVAYFERYATVQDQLVLDVPRARLDDFLKSLTIVDLDSRAPLPLSYANSRGADGQVRLVISLPPGKRRVKLAYVTESPAWKPSYRVMLDETGARLQGWAVVDNVSSEAWRDVTVGVGSTSALSFKYDLQSVQIVERRTIDGAERVAAAPPEGGTPYTVEGLNVRVIGELDEGGARTAGVSLAGATSTEHIVSIEVGGSSGRAFSTSDIRSIPVGNVQRGRTDEIATARAEPPLDPFEAVVAQLQDNDMRVRIEAFRLPTDPAGSDAALGRANAVRERLASRGIADTRIEVEELPAQAPDPAKSVRIVAVDEPTRPAQAAHDVADDAPHAEALFVAERPMTIEARHSAMVTLFDAPTEARRVYLYDPISDRGSKRYAFNAVKVENPTTSMLDTGPITVYAGEQFLGEGLTEPIPPRAVAVVPYGLDRNVQIEASEATEDTIEQLTTIERGIATTQSRRTRRTTLEISHRGREPALLYVRHHVPSGWTLAGPAGGLEKLRGDHLVPVRLQPGRATRLVLEASMPIVSQIDLRSDDGLRAVAVHLRAESLPSELRTRLTDVLAAHRKLGDLEAELSSRRTAMADLRLRIDELTEQLVALRKVGRAQALSGDLATRMRRLGDELDRTAAVVAELESKRLTARIDRDHRIAELTRGPSTRE